MASGQRRIDRILDPSFLDRLHDRPLVEIRSMRADVEIEETVLSYERRLLQARIDILGAERERRAGGGGSLIERLPEILADEPSPSRGAFPRSDPPALENSRRRVERLVSDDTLLRLPDIPDAEVNEIVSNLSREEHEVSDQRRKVLGVLDALREEIGRRYQSGEASPEDVLSGS